MRVNYSNVGRSPNYRGSPAPTSKLLSSVLSCAPATGGGLSVLAKAEKARRALEGVTYESPSVHGV